MLISHKYQFIYTKTVKTAGTSIEVYFEPFCMPEGEWQFSHKRDEYSSPAGIIGVRAVKEPGHGKGYTWWNHMPAAEIKENIGDEVWESYFRFCAIRNPFDKVVSHYFFMERPVANQHEFLKKLPFYSAIKKRRLIHGFNQWLDKVEYPVDRAQYMLDGKFCMDDFIRFEHLPEDLARICKRLGIPYQPEKLRRLHGAIRKTDIPLKAFYTPASIQKVSDLYDLEIEKFGYGLV